MALLARNPVRRSLGPCRRPKRFKLCWCLQGNMPALLSHYRPDHPIYTFTEDRAVQRRLAVYHGVTAIYMPFQDTAEETFKRCGPSQKELG